VFAGSRDYEGHTFSSEPASLSDIAVPLGFRYNIGIRQARPARTMFARKELGSTPLYPSQTILGLFDLGLEHCELRREFWEVGASVGG
jgi:hypothetical protein